MSTPRTQAEPLPRGLVAGVLALTLVVLALGGAVVAVRLRPEPLPENAVDRTIVQWQDAVDDDPDNAEMYTGLGLALQAADRDGEARAAFEQAVTLDDRAWLAKFQLGLLVEDADPDRAADLISNAAKLAPEQERVAPLIAYGDLLLSQGDAAGARDAYRRSIVYDPFLFDSHFGLGAAYEALGNEKAALQSYEDAARFDPNDTEVAEAIDRLGG